MRSNVAHNGGLEGEDEDLENEERDTNENEAKHLTASEGDSEALVLVVTAEVGNLDIAHGGDHHANVASEHGGSSANKEANGGVGELGVSEVVSPGLVDGADEDTGEEDAEKGEHGVLLDEESFGTIIDEAGDLLHLFEALFVGPGEDLTDVLGFLFLAVVDFDLVTIHFDTSNSARHEGSPSDGDNGEDNDDVV